MNIIVARGDSSIDTAETRQALDSFLSSVQRRAFTMARAAVGDSDDAMDIVQDSMLQLATSYANKSPEEWRKLFYRILNNKINDQFRRRKRRQLFSAILPGLMGQKAANMDEQSDPFDSLPGHSANPAVSYEREQTINTLHAAISILPRRQREAFTLRCWEGFSTRQTAETMACSEGSVKTHYSRALESLRSQLEGQNYEYGD